MIESINSNKNIKKFIKKGIKKNKMEVDLRIRLFLEGNSAEYVFQVSRRNKKYCKFLVWTDNLEPVHYPKYTPATRMSELEARKGILKDTLALSKEFVDVGFDVNVSSRAYLGIPTGTFNEESIKIIKERIGGLEDMMNNPQESTSASPPSPATPSASESILEEYFKSKNKTTKKEKEYQERLRVLDQKLPALIENIKEPKKKLSALKALEQEATENSKKEIIKLAIKCGANPKTAMEKYNLEIKNKIKKLKKDLF